MMPHVSESCCSEETAYRLNTGVRWSVIHKIASYCFLLSVNRINHLVANDAVVTCYERFVELSDS